MTRGWGAGLALATVAAACGGGDPAMAGPEVVREMHGDTTIVRTVSGSVWGGEARLVPDVSIGTLEGADEYLFGRIVSIGVGPDGTIYVVDGQVPDLRAFAPDGTYLRTIGRPGEGPGELSGPDGGLQVLTDGRIVVRDPGNARLQVYAPDGEPVATWSHRGGLRTSNPLPWDAGDHVYPLIVLDPTLDFSEWKTGLVRVGPDGVPGDTISIPDLPYAAPTLEARAGSTGNVSISIQNVPFAPTEVWALHPEGWFVHGIADRYAITLMKPAGPVRIERVVGSVPVSAGERTEAETRITRQMRQVDPDWSWGGAGIPDTKPAFRELFAGRDGRIWVRVSAEGVQVDDPDWDPSDPASVPNGWREPNVFDVFGADGTYLGRVTPPEDFSTSPTPVFDGEHVWAVTRDELGVQRVVRYRLVTPPAT